jgi:beta-lactamase regulating signal transducer with metallopeptidase domain
MIALQDFFEPAARIAVQGLINSLWQGAVIACLAWALMRVLKRTNAATRYAMWWLVLAVIMTTAALSARLAALDAEITAASLGAGPFGPLATSAPGLAQSHPSTPQTEEAAPAIETGEGSLAASLIYPVEFLRGWLLDAVFFAWLAGVFWKLVRLASGYFQLQVIKRNGLPVSSSRQKKFEDWLSAHGERRPVSLFMSDRASTPMAAGFIRPAIILPATLAEGLTDAEFDQVVLHELAHVRRRDDWAKLAQKLIESAFFFHPAVLWIGERLNLEREVACDDRVVSVTGESKPYAACLIKLVEITGLRRSSVLAPGAVIRKNHISRRVEMLLDKKRNATLRISVAGLTMLIAALSLAVVAGVHVSPVIALVKHRDLAVEIPGSYPELDAKRSDSSAAPARNEPGSKAELRSHAPAALQQETLVPRTSDRQQLNPPSPPIPASPPSPPSLPALPANWSEAEQAAYQKRMEQYEQALKQYNEKMREYEKAMDRYDMQMDAYNEQMREYEKAMRQYEIEMREFDKKIFELVPVVVTRLFTQEIDRLESNPETRARLHAAAGHAAPIIARELIDNLRDLKINRPEGFIMIVSNLSAGSIGSKLRNIFNDANAARALQLAADERAKLEQAIERISPSLQRLVVYRFER